MKDIFNVQNIAYRFFLIFKILLIDFANYSFNILADDQKQTAVRTLKQKTETEQQTQQEKSQH